MTSSRGGGPKSRNRSAREYCFAALLALSLTVAVGHGNAWADGTAADTGGGSVGTSESTKTNATTGPSSVGTVTDPPNSAEGTKKTTTETTRATSTFKDTTPDGDLPKRRTAAATPPEGAAAETDTSKSTETAQEPPLTGPTETLPTGPPETLPTTAAETPTTAAPTTAAETPPTKPSGAEALSLETVTQRAAALETDSVLRAADVATPTARTPDTARAMIELEDAGSFAALAAAPAALSSTAVSSVTVAPTPPSPPSLIAEIIALPGRIVNTVLQVLGITTSAGNPVSPLSPGPIAELVFGIFRRIEEVLGLTAPVMGLPVPPSMTYTGPLDMPTPTVAQFLNAATTAYVLGGTPGGMVPLTVDGWPLEHTDTLTGMSAKVWVTPQQHIIIAYSGTTGGTNLLFNPLIAFSQVLTDLAAGFGDTPPAAFTQAVDFAKLVQEEATKQGYTPDSIFVTGHSLGGWEAGYVAQQLGLPGIGFESPGLPSVVPGNGADGLFVNTVTYGDMAGYLASDLPGLQPLAPAYVPAGGTKPHWGPIVMLGDPNSINPMVNSARLWGQGLIGSLIGLIDLFGNFLGYHLPGVQAYNLGVVSDPAVVPWLGTPAGPVHNFSELTIPQFLKAASDAGILVAP